MQRIGQACPGNQKKKKKRIRKRQRAGKMKKKKKRKEEEATSRDQEKKKKKKKRKKKATYWMKPMHLHMGIFVIYLSNSPHSAFSHFGENFLASIRRKHLTPTNIFLSLSLFQPNTLQKVFFPHFLSFFFFIFPKIHSTKHTLNVKNAPM